jgi:hypothetical protein
MRKAHWMMAGIAFAATACASGTSGISGKIIDANGGAPLANVIVVQVRYRAPFLSEGDQDSEGVVLTRTDAQGRFHFDGWIPRKGWRPFYLDGYDSYIFGYKKDYTEADAVRDAAAKVIRLKRSDGSFEQKTAYMAGLAANVRSALPLHQEDQAAFPLFEQLMADATAMATTPEQHDYVDGEFRRRVFQLPPPRAPRPPIPIIHHQSPTAPQQTE